MKLEKIDEGIIFGSNAPKAGDKSGYMPFFCPMDDGRLLVAQTIGSHFDAPDSHVFLLTSTDGKTFTPSEKPIANFVDEPYNITECFKVTNAGGDHVVAVGYGFIMNRGEGVGPGNAATGGLLDTPVLFQESFDGGKTWSVTRRIPTVWGEHTEASAPIVILPNGDYVTPIAAMPDWEGGYASPLCGRLLRSRDGGKTWSDSTVTMNFGPDTTVWEQRLCVTDTGKLVDIAWVENLRTGTLYNNRIAVSTDNGETFGEPIDTGVHGQASCVCPLKGDRILTIHSMRKDVDRYGVKVCIANLENGFEIEDSFYAWEPNFAMKKVEGMNEVFSMMRFGQPSMVRLDDGTFLYCQWLMENDVCRTIWQKYRLTEE